jgi:hypothetical protein
VTDEPQPGIPEEPLLPDGPLLALLILDGVLLGVAGLAFTPLHLDGASAPLGALASIALLPWLVARAGEVDPRTGWAAAPLTAWGVTVGVLGVAGPGGDVLLPVTWQSLLLLFGGLGAGLWRLRRL